MYSIYFKFNVTVMKIQQIGYTNKHKKMLGIEW